ncbi:TIGR02444 family protein [Tardiphaga sp. OK246]|jgi:uncharacterized protein (TIGR02444 family)|uniref:TIGR02444 family protein n=1 Tax=Tardiphaga sp. OK246 TaxID=1855307 RepID=UPI000B682985|nr:TIGR02444 family protein [Tardiphaga sp. OK246]SNS46530.1 TIGR02444 family protein [Tardiphaga sp. OK246]
MTEGSTTADDSWAFALRLYAKPGVAEACLTLQAEAGVDVMMMLVATFAASQRNILLTPADIEAMNDICRPWREQVVHPLRALRITLKSGPAPAPSNATHRLREQIKASELTAERLENDLLASWLEQKMPAQQQLARVDLVDIVKHIVRQASGAQHNTVALAIDTIVIAAIGE